MQLSSVEVLSGTCCGKRIEVCGPVLNIGRDEDNDLILPDPVVLRKHARLLINVNSVFLEDRSSVGQTRVHRAENRLLLDDQHPSIELKPDDRIELGLEGLQDSVLLALHFDAPPTDAQIFAAKPVSDVAAFAASDRLVPILRTLALADRAILSSQSFSEVLQHIADAALSLISRATHVTLVLRQDLANPSDKSNDFVFALCRARGKAGSPNVENAAPRLVRSVFQRVIDDRAAVLAADAPSGTLASESLLGASIQSTVAVPLWQRDTIIGVLQLDNRDSPAMFDRTDLDALAVLAGTASLALSNASIERRLQLVEAVLRDENRYLRHQAQPTRAEVSIVGKSPAMLKLLAQVDRVAATRATVLIEGETGVGKELVAASVHSRSPRAERLFVAQNCAALPENLLESELFGHQRGAFTGATEDKKGLFEVADGGTLFLDEVAEMPLLLQAKLLRVLQEGEIRPLGATRARQVNVRIVAACNKKLEAEVAAGRFRQDLYFRLNVFPIRVPPLRERKEDIALLVEHFFARYAREYRKNLLGFAEGVLAHLTAYDWPGNVRELENEVQRLVIQADASSFVTLQHLGTRIRGAENVAQARKLPKGTLKEMMDHVERDLIATALREHGNNKTATAKTLGMTREGFHKKLRLLGKG